MTYQPPGGAPPEPTPYAQPQDPWAGGHEPGVAQAPTDPIPQQQPYPPGQYTPGVATPSVWTQETLAHGGYTYVQAPPRSRVGVYILVFLAIVVLGGGGFYGAYYVVTHRSGNVTPQGQGSTTATVTPTTATTANPSPTVDASAIKVNDCIFNLGTQEKPSMTLVPCDKPGSFKVVKIASGEDIPEGPDGKFDRDTTAAKVCNNITYQAWYGWDSSDDTKDFFFCLTTN